MPYVFIYVSLYPDHIMKRITCFTLAIFALSSISCNQSEDTSIQISFNPSSASVDAGTEYKLPFMVSTDGASWKKYDYNSHRYDIQLSSSNEDIIALTDTGYVYARTPGYASVTAVLNDSKAKFSFLVNDAGYNLDFDYKKALTKGMIYSNENILSNNTAMQNFDILKNGDIIVGGSKGAAVYYQRMAPNQQAGLPMTMWYSGHCTNFAVEENNGEVYIWASNFASKTTTDASYNREQIVSRVKFVPGSSLKPEDCTDHYYVGPNNGTTTYAAVDMEHNLLAIYNNNQIKIYDINEAKDSPVKEFQLSEILRGGEAGSPISKDERVNLKIKAHDLTSIAMKGKFSVDWVKLNGYNSFGEQRAMQGMCIYKDKIYIVSGSSNPDVSVSILNFNGKIEKLCQQFSFEDNVQDLIDAGMAQDGRFEPEGIKIRYGKLYLGFIWGVKGISPTDWRSSIIKYN